LEAHPDADGIESFRLNGEAVIPPNVPNMLPQKGTRVMPLMLKRNV
jgi:hypothetical protein